MGKRHQRRGPRADFMETDFHNPGYVYAEFNGSLRLTDVEELGHRLTEAIDHAHVDVLGRNSVYTLELQAHSALMDGELRTETMETIRRILRPRFNGTANISNVRGRIIINGKEHVGLAIQIKIGRGQVRIPTPKNMPQGISDMVVQTGLSGAQYLVFTTHFNDAVMLSLLCDEVCYYAGIRLEGTQTLELNMIDKAPISILDLFMIQEV